MARRGRAIPEPQAPVKAGAGVLRVDHPKARGRTGSVQAAVGVGEVVSVRAAVRVREVVSVREVVNVQAAGGAAEGSGLARGSRRGRPAAG